MRINIEIDPERDDETVIRNVANALYALVGHSVVENKVTIGVSPNADPGKLMTIGLPNTVPTPPPVTAPAPVVAPPAATSGPVDADGLPWDERIHGGEKKQNADGRWKKKRAVAAELVTAVEAELRAAAGAAAPPPAAPVAAPAPTPTPVAPPVTAPAVDPAVAAYIAAGGTIPPVAPPAAAAPAPAPTPEPAPAPPPPAAPDGAFINFMNKLNENPALMPTLIAQLPQVGLQTVVQLNQHPHLIPTVAGLIGLTL